MLRHAARRILWIPPTLVGFSLAFFWLLTLLGLRPHEDASLPRFLNFSPTDLGSRAPALARSVAEHDDRGAANELARLGGAALPHVLPVWDTWTPEERARVALALVPVFVRMGALPSGEVEGAAAVLQFNRFWQDYSAEFKPTRVTRLVERVARRPQVTRTREISRLDTFALAELIRRMSPVRTDADVASVGRLAEFASRSSGQRLLLPRHPTVADAERVARLWQRWWAAHRADYTTLSGPMRLAATVTETQYGRWVASLLGTGLGETKNGAPVVQMIWAPLETSMTLLGVALIAGCGLALFFGRLDRKWQRPWHPGRRRELTRVVLATLVVSVPAAVAYFLSLVGGAQNEGFARVLAPGLLASGVVAALCILSMLVRHGPPANSTVKIDALYESAGRGRSGLAWRAALAPLGGDTALVLLAVLLAEGLARLEGLGRLTTEAVHAGDFSMLMAVGLIGTLTALLLGLVSDGALGARGSRLLRPLGEERLS